MYKGKSIKITDMDEEAFDEIHTKLDSFNISGNMSTAMQSGFMGSGVGQNAILQSSSGGNLVGSTAKIKASTGPSNQQSTMFQSSM